MINESTIFVVALLAALTLVISHKYFLLPYIIAACFVPADQRIIIMGLDFTVLRILIIAGVLRILIHREQVYIKWNNFDRLVLVWAICGSLIYILQWADIRSIINRCGHLFDVLGLYWLFRQRIRSWNDVRFVFKLLAFSAIILAPLIALEWATGRNPFVVLGKVVTVVRQGRYRCQGAFPHSIILGLFWATLIPVFIGFAKTERNNHLYWAAIAAGIFIICATASSTPLATLIEVLLLMALFRYRMLGRYIVYSICGMTIVLHMIMKAPVWHLVARINIVGGSTGWHRYHLIDKAISNFGEWALLGTVDTRHWGRGLADVTNQYILEGIRGGFITLILFVLLLIMAVKVTCRYSIYSGSSKQRWLGWCICVSVLSHCLSFLSVAYFGQIMMLLYLTFALVGLVYEVSEECRVTKTHLRKPYQRSFAWMPHSLL